MLFALCDALVVLFRGWANIYMLLFVSMFCKCRELTENKYEKKAERVFAYSLLTAKALPSVD